VIGALLAGVFGCAEVAPLPSPSTTSDPVFPHPAGYDEAGHGADAAASPAVCLGCHSLGEGEPVRGAEAVAPACRSCHADYPHVPDYGRVADHAADWAARGEDCQACHGADGAAVPGATCSTCHTSYPHPAGWEEGVGHGAAWIARGAAACDGCHGEGDPGGGCTECHLDVPHTAGFAAPDAHGAAWRADPASCTSSCHPADATAPKVACASCHDLFPHADGWPAGHYAVVQARGEGACALCHEPGTPAGPAMPVSCAASCHGGAP
jgi:hypothetical protein